MVTMMPLMMLIMNGLSLAIIWVGAHQIAESSMQVGDMMAFMQYAMQIVFAFLMMSMMFIFLPRAAVSGERIADVLETEIEIKDPEQPRTLPSPLRERSILDVSFRYPDAEGDVVLDVASLPGRVDHSFYWIDRLREIHGHKPYPPFLCNQPGQYSAGWCGYSGR